MTSVGTQREAHATHKVRLFTYERHESLNRGHSGWIATTTSARLHDFPDTCE